MVKILDRYVFSEGLKYFTLSLLTFLTLFAIIDMVSNLDIFMKLGFEKGITYVLGRFPLYGVRIIPIGVLLAAMITLSRFSATSELIVVKSLGISIYRFSLPLIFLSVLASFLSLTLQEKAVPEGLKRVKEIEALMDKRKEEIPINGIWLTNSKGEFIFFWEFIPSKEEARRITVLKVKGVEPQERIDALKGTYRGRGVWELEEGFVRNLRGLKSTSFTKRRFNLAVTPKEILLSWTTPESMSLSELFFTVKRLEKIG